MLQSAGRVIRTEKTEGLILLLDERFSTGRYREYSQKENVPTLYCESLTKLHAGILGMLACFITEVTQNSIEARERKVFVVCDSSSRSGSSSFVCS